MFPKEKEVLFEPGTRFKVLDREPRPDPAAPGGAGQVHIILPDCPSDAFATAASPSWVTGRAVAGRGRARHRPYPRRGRSWRRHRERHWNR
jgi:hypothetical protein